MILIGFLILYQSCILGINPALELLPLFFPLPRIYFPWFSYAQPPLPFRPYKISPPQRCIPWTTRSKVAFQLTYRTAPYFNFLPSTYYQLIFSLYIPYVYSYAYIFNHYNSTETVLEVDLLLYAQDTQYLAYVRHSIVVYNKSTTIWDSLLIKHVILSQKKKGITKTHL